MGGKEQANEAPQHFGSATSMVPDRADGLGRSDHDDHVGYVDLLVVCGKAELFRLEILEQLCRF